MNIHQTLIDNDYDHYVVAHRNGEHTLQHRSTLSAILECGDAQADYGITDYQQCWGGQDLGEDSVHV